jgi:hypothetical protein
MEWYHTSQKKKKKKKKCQKCTLGQQSYGNCLLGYILFDFLLKGETVIAACNVQVLKKQQGALCVKC